MCLHALGVRLRRARGYDWARDAAASRTARMVLRAAIKTVTASVREMWKRSCNPELLVRSTSSYIAIGSWRLFLNRRSGPPLLFTYCHVWPTTVASAGTVSDSTKRVG